MLTNNDIMAEAGRLKFADCGFTNAAPFDSQRDYLLAQPFWLLRNILAQSKDD